MPASYLGRSLLSGVDLNTTPLTGSITVDSSADFCIVAVEAGDDVGQPEVTTVTLGGVSMSSLGTRSNGLIAGLPSTVELFGLVSPPTGSQTLTVNFNLPPFTAHATAIYFSGVNQTTPTEGHQTTTGTGTAVNAGVSTTTVSGDLIVGHVIANLVGNANISTADTEIAEVVGTNFADIMISVAYQAITGSGAQVNWTLTTSVPYRGQAVVVKSAAGGGGTAYFQTITGSMTLSGIVRKQVRTTKSGAVVPSGSLNKRTARILRGSVAPTGGVNKLISKYLAGVINASGSIGISIVIQRLLQGSITVSGALSKGIYKTVSGSLAVSGAITKRIYRDVGGVITSTGSLVKTTAKTLVGAVTPIGNLSTSSVIQMLLQSALTLTGSLTESFIPWVERVGNRISNNTFIRRFIGRR